MSNLPVVLKIILNILFYVIYAILSLFIFGLILPLLQMLFDKPIFNQGDLVFDKIAIILAIVVLFITIILRKYFYISFDKRDENTYKKEVYIKEKKKDNYFEDEDDLEIFVWKEKR